MSSPTQRMGHDWEAEAEKWLAAKGLLPVERNFRVRVGEIDLIMRDGETLVFVEVKYRRHGRFVAPLEQVTAAKQRKLRRTAELYLQRYRHPPPCRFDVVSCTPEHFDWITNAF